MKEFSFRPSGVCSTLITFGLEDGKIYNVHMIDSCPGNSQAISKLVEGADAAQVAAILKGNNCGWNPTSCADQLSKAIEKALAES